MKRIRIIWVFLLMMGLFHQSLANAQTEKITIVSDQLMDTNTAFMQGFINGGVNYNTSLTQHLKPAFWGFGWDVIADYDYTTPNFNLIKMVSIYSAYMSYFGIGDPLLLQPWTDGYVQWDNFVNTMINQSISTNRPVDFWSVWGEPDATFSGTPSQYIELFRRTDSIIHAVDPGAKMVGPDFINFGIGELLFFIDTLHTLNIHPPAISWHEFGDYPEAIYLHVQEFRDSILARPFAGDPEIHIQEYGDPDNRLIPGWAVGWLYYFEQSEIDWASRGCFNEFDGTNVWDDCWDGLSGMYMSDGNTPQPLYWLHRAYAGLHQPQRLITTNEQIRTISLASKNDLNQEMKIIVGRYYSPLQGSPDPTATVEIKISHFPYGNNSTQPLVIQKIPAQTVAYSVPLNSPTTVFSGNINFIGDSATITLNAFVDGDAYVIYINPDAGSVLSDDGGLNESTNDEMVEVFPNPATQQVMLRGVNAYEQIVIMNVWGEVVYDSEVEQTEMTILLSDFTPGLYTILLSSNEKLVTYKLVLQ